MAVQTTTNAVKLAILSTIGGFIIGLAVGSAITYKYITIDYFKVYKTNIGFMVFIKDKLYNLSEMRSLE